MMALRYLKGASTLRLDREKCTGCGVCLQVCPHGVFRLSGRKAEITDADLCMECGACRLNCAFGALDVNSGVGCAAAVINGMLKGTDPSCGCGGGDEDGGCCC